VSVASTRYQPHRPVGDLLREWRQRRRLSQLDLAIQADVSARHLSFVETGRSRPASAMILRLTEHLDVPLRDRNTLLLAGGYAPAYPVGNFFIAIRPSGCSLSPSRRSCSCHSRMCSG